MFIVLRSGGRIEEPEPDSKGGGGDRVDQIPIKHIEIISH